MAKRLIPLFASLLAIAFFVTRCPIEAASADYPVPQGPASINGHDAGKYPHLTLTVPALPHCDGGESYVPADGGGMRCGSASGGGAPIVDGGFSVFLDGSSRGVILPLPVALGGTGSTPACSTGQILVAGSSTAFQCETPNGDITAFDDLANTTVGTIGAGEIAVGSSTGTLTAVAGATAPGLAQVSTSSATGVNMIDVTQLSTNANGSPGNRIMRIPTETGSGTPGSFIVERGTQPYAYLGAWPLNTAYAALYLGPNITPGGVSEANANYALLAGASQLAFGSQGTFDWYGDGTHLSTWSGYTGEIQFGFNVAIGTTGGGTYGGGTKTEYIANGTPSSGPCTGGTCVGSSSAGGLAAFGAGDGTFPNVTTLQGAWTSPSTTYSALAFGRGPSCGFTTTGTGANGCSFTIPVRATFGSTITMNAITSAKCVGASSGCQVGSGSTPPDVWTQSATAIQLLFAPDGTPGSYSTHGSPTSVTSYATTQAGDSCALSASASTITLTCTPVVVTGTPILWWEVRILDLEIN